MGLSGRRRFGAPRPVGEAVQAKRPVRTAGLVGADRPPVTALLVPKWEHLRTDLGRDGDPESLVGDERVLAEVQKAVDKVNAGLAHWETVKHFRLLPRDFEESEGERTPSLKIKRAAIRRNYADLIEEMYAEGAKRREGDKKPAQSA